MAEQFVNGPAPQQGAFDEMSDKIGRLRYGTISFTKTEPGTLTLSNSDTYLVFFGSTATNMGIWMLYCSSGNAYVAEIKSSGRFTVTTSGNTVTFTYTGSASGTMYLPYLKVY